MKQTRVKRSKKQERETNLDNFLKRDKGSILSICVSFLVFTELSDWNSALAVAYATHDAPGFPCVVHRPRACPPCLPEVNTPGTECGRRVVARTDSRGIKH
ncbi:hypothetical protein RRG08_047571 [Elysia crispata]|uniref:Uncharacterized protein n=1 Tax=Elysia crispata TaxID=231223 RepID=A0AAE0YP64_9GAST|nr:hypothetical protein RRG08_047571 [Elysia crispata]